MTTQNKTLSILLIVQLAIVAFVYWPGTDKAVPKTTFFADVSLDQIQGLTITDEEQTSITMAINEGRWQIQEGGYPGNPETIKAILTKIIALESSRLVTTTKSSQVRLKVAPDVFNRKVEMQLADNTTKSFFLGTAPNNKTIHFRMAGQNQVYQVKDLASWEMQTDNKSWWQTSYIDEAEDDLQSVKISNPLGTFNLQRGAENNWLITEITDEQKISQEEINTLISSISKISLADYLDKEKPENLDKPTCTIDYTTKSGPFSLTIWPEDEENGVHRAKASNSEFYVTIRTYLLQELLEAQPSIYLTKTAPPKVEAPSEEQLSTPSAEN